MKYKKQTTSFNEIKNYLQTGDIILMHGVHVSSHIIETIEGCPWSHAAMVIKGSDVGISNGDDDLLLWESDYEAPVADIIIGKPKSGPMLVSLKERLKYNFTHNESSRIVVRHLYYERNPEMFNTFKNHILPSVHSKKFPDTKHEIFDPIKGRLFHKKLDIDTFFCSQLAAHTYMQWGLLSKLHPDYSYAPLDFSETLSVNLLKRAWLGNEIELDINVNEL